RWVDNNQSADLDGLDRRVRVFMQEHESLFRIDPGMLVLNRETSSHLGDRKQIWYLQYDFVYNGVPVLDAQAQFTVVAGNLVQIGMDKVGRLELSTGPRLGQKEAFAAAVRSADRSLISVEEVLDPGTLYILPIASEGMNAANDPLATVNYAGR